MSYHYLLLSSGTVDADDTSAILCKAIYEADSPLRGDEDYRLSSLRGMVEVKNED